MPRLHNYSQHFLRSPRLVAELVGHSNVRKNDTVIDLGAGSGVITSVLSRRAKRIVAVENEPKTLAKLKQNLARAGNVEIVNADILQYKPPTEPYKVFANIPFSISAAIVRRYTSLEQPAKSIYLIVQKQFARKLTMGDSHFTSQLGAQVAPWWSVRIRRPLRKTDFTPPPAVDTVLLELKPLEKPLLDKAGQGQYQDFVATCFSSQTFFAKQPRSAAGISPERKPSEINASQWVALYYHYSHAKKDTKTPTKTAS